MEETKEFITQEETEAENGDEPEKGYDNKNGTVLVTSEKLESKRAGIILTNPYAAVKKAKVVATSSEKKSSVGAKLKVGSTEEDEDISVEDIIPAAGKNCSSKQTNNRYHIL